MNGTDSKPVVGLHGTMDTVSNGHQSDADAAVRLSPTSPFVTMRHYISEFDPDENSTYMSMNALKLAESWKIYIDTFNDLCDIDKVPVEKRRKLLLLLAGTKLQNLLSKLEASTETTMTSTTTATLEESVRLLTQHFENRRAIQMSRYNFFYGAQNRRKPGESLQDWTGRLIRLSENCQFSKDVADGMTVNDALMVVMYKQTQEDELSSKKGSGVKAEHQKVNKTDSIVVDADVDDEDEDDGIDDDEPSSMPVEIQWGESDELATKSGLGISVQGQFAGKSNGVGLQRTAQPGHVNANLSSSENLTHADMDLLRRAKGGPCICPNCTLYPKRRAGKHNCHVPGCGREYSKTSHLRAHLVSHCNVLPFACSWVGCGKRFYRTDQLTRHARIHTGEKKFQCQFCEHAFSRSDHLTKHMKRHSNTGAQSGNGVIAAVQQPPSAVPVNPHSRVLNPSPRLPPNGTVAILPVSTTANTMMSGQQHMLAMPQLHYNMAHVATKNPPQFAYN